MAAPDLTVSLGPLSLDNPVCVASGTFGNGEEMAELIDIGRLGAIFLKGATRHAREGNAPQRIVETPAGLLNAIGLQNPGIEETLRDKAPYVAAHHVPCIVNISGRSNEEYAEMAAMCDACAAVTAVEMNVSCPNVAKGGMAFGTDAATLRVAVSAARDAMAKPLIVKLSPNVTSIADMARAAADAGADALSLINTLVGMAIDVRRRRPVLARGIGGLSGPAIRPVAVRMVWEVSRAVDIPVIGIGGIVTPHDALEFFVAGASAIQVGTASFFNPRAAVDILDGVTQYMTDNNLESLGDLRAA